MSQPEQLSLFRRPPDAADRRLRKLLLGNRVIDYELRQVAGRRLAMSIDERGLRVNAPKSLALHAIERFVRDNGDWVLRKLDEYAGRAAPRHLTICHGVAVPVLGAEVPVLVEPGGNRVKWHPDRLVLAARSGADLNALARRALQRRALDDFTIRVDRFASRLGRPAPALALSSARTRWGSCSNQTGIRLNWRLVHLPPQFADYVVAHEIAHLVHMNHSRRFWHLVGELYPEWQAIREELNQRAAGIPII